MSTNIQSLNIKHEYVPCVLCGEDNVQIKHKIKKTNRIWMDSVEHSVNGTETLVSCKTCGLVYVNPRLVRVSGLGTYSIEEEMAYFEGTRESRHRAFGEVISQLPLWLGRGPKSLLDIGCGDGTLLEIARSTGIESVGTEISESLVELVRTHLGEQAILSVNLEDLPESSFDVVTMINVIEHVDNPAEFLKTTARLLKIDGILLVHTINIGGLPARLSGARWYQIEPFSHFYYFTEQTLQQLMQRSGLEPFGRFSLVISKGLKRTVQQFLARNGIYLDNGLGIVARRLH